ncbi:molybdenum cofactor guanylyltransferase [Abditibacteriota bacterium]|nr:molybdenum cofactor guanylyltransferase [Abditibacteriota bacterium]
MNRIRCAAILAGGLSTRMGRDKALLELEGEPLIRRAARILEPLFERVIVVTNREEVALAAQIPAVADAHANKGPLAGIEAVLSYFGEATFIVACDLPYLNSDFIGFQCQQWRDELDALVAQSDDGLEPLHAIWAPSALPLVRSSLQAERPPSLRRVFGGLKGEVVDVAEARHFDARLRCFENWNTPADVGT